MQIRLADYNEGVITKVSKEYEPKSLDIEFIDFVYSQNIALEGTIEKGSDTLTFRGHLTSEIQNICGRCLKAVPRRLACPFEFFYEIKGKETLETLDDLRETLILEHPISFVCQESCRGLCPQCGINRNELRCACTPSKEFSPNVFSQLKNIWASKKGGGHG